jgi:polysaccharide pyruvyl transferase WcaK-like protein
MRVAISGAGFSNKGAEAMLRTVQAELAKRIPSTEFSLWQCPERHHRLALHAGFMPLFWPVDQRSPAARTLSRVALPAWAARQLSPRDPAALLRARAGRDEVVSLAYRRYLERTGCSIDAVVDISGFAYGDAWPPDRAMRNRGLTEYCVAHGAPIMYLPQAWGSFEKTETREAVRRMLTVPGTAFYSRDSQSSRHLERLLTRPEGSIAIHPDIAFAFRGGTAEQGEQVLRAMGCGLQRPVIGVAPNMHVYRRVAGTGGANHYVQALLRLVEHCLGNHDVDVVLQASEMEVFGAAVDDRYLCGVISAAVNQPGRCYMTQETLTAGQTAAMISQFDYLVGSRFHSLVLGLAEGVPAMAIGWSHKYRELLSLFGLESDVSEFQELDGDTLVSTFERGWAARESVRPQIVATAAALRSQVGELFDGVAETILQAVTA